MAYGRDCFRGSHLWWGKLTGNGTWRSDHIVVWSHLANQKWNLSSSIRPVTTKSARMLTYNEGNSLVMSNDHVVIWDHVTNEEQNISYSARPAVTKLSRVVTYDDANPLTKAHDTSTVWSRGKSNMFLSSLSQIARTTNLEGWWLEWEDPTQHIMCYNISHVSGAITYHPYHP